MPSSPGAKRKHRRRAPFEQAIEASLRPGAFIRVRESVSFVKGLENVARSVDELLADEPNRAAELYETFLAGCYEKTREVDDSYGELGRFMQQLCCRWVRARQAAGTPAEETVAVVLSWMDRDEYGYTFEIERPLVEVLDDAGLGALARQARARFDEGVEEARGRAGEIGADAAKRHWMGVLRTVHRARRDALAMIRLCRETETSAADCLAIAEIFESHGELEQALGWVRRGRDPTKGSGGSSLAVYGLKRVEKTLLKALGRSDESLALAWREFQDHPGPAAFEELLEYAPDAERSAWYERALDRAGTADLWAAMELFIETKEPDRLLARLEAADEESIRNASHYTLRQAAKLLERPHPSQAARLYASLGMRIVDEGRSKHYRSALSHLARAKKCYEKAGLQKEWEELEADVRQRHHRKSSFMPRFEALATGESHPQKRSSFLERARQRWTSGEE